MLNRVTTPKAPLDTMHLTQHFDLSAFNTMGLVSHAQFGAVIAERRQVGEVARFATSSGLPAHFIGGGSNLVLRDELAAIVGVMATKGRNIERGPDGTVIVTAQAGEDWSEFVGWTVSQGIGGLENLAGIPGTVGAAPIQNIGAYGLELADRFLSLTAWDSVDHKERVFERDECQFSYRQSLFKQAGGRFIVLDVTLALPQEWVPVLSYAGLDNLPADVDAAAVMERVLAIRRSKLPDWHVLGNAGSFFHNPVVQPAVADGIAGVPRYPQPDGRVKLSAAWLIDACGLKGHQEGQAAVHKDHALIIVNRGGATYGDVHKLASTIKHAVEERFGVVLTQEPIEL